MTGASSAAYRAQRIADLSDWYHRADGPLAKSRALAETGSFWRASGQFDRARTCFEQALKLAADLDLAQEGLGAEMLRAGEFKQGMALFDAGRWRLDRWSKYNRAFAVPFWDGQSLQGKRILVWCEQGIGDHILQVRVLEALVALGARVTLEADARLFELLGPVRQQVTCLPQTNPPNLQIQSDPFDLQTSALSAWRFLQPPLIATPYLCANTTWSAQYKASWEQHSKPMINIGLSWFSTSEDNADYRSLDMSWLYPLAHHKDRVRFHSLQYGVDDLPAEAKKMHATLCHDPQIDHFTDLGKLAAYFNFMDLVITVDNVTAHLAGALGVETWLLLPKSSHWHWGLDPNATRLYPTVRLFRAQDHGYWDDVLVDLYNCVNEFLADRV